MKRFASMWAMSLAIFFLTWVASYLFLPQAILRAKLPTMWIYGVDVDVPSTFLKIFAFNFLIGGVILTLGNLMRVGDVPLGYVAVWGQIFLFGILKGTNSFVYPYETQWASLIGFLRTGLWEFTAYILMTCSTIEFEMYRQESWISSKLTKIRKRSEIRLTRREQLAFLLGTLILLLSAFLESLAIFAIIP